VLEKSDNIQVILEDLDDSNITSLVKKWDEINTIRKEIEKLEEVIKNKIKIFLKERKWTKYNDDETKISITLSVQKRDIVDMEQLKLVLSEVNYNTVVRTTTFEKLVIINPETRAKLKKLVR